MLKVVAKIGGFTRFVLAPSSIFKVLKFGRDLAFLQFYKSQILVSAFQFSFLSLSVIFLTSLCTGAVLTLQTYSGLGEFASAGSIARVVVPAIIRELGPVLTGLMIAGRISSSFAAEIATMKAMDQVPALKILSIDPAKFLLMPRVFVGVMLMPLLLIIANVIAILGSWLVVVFKFNITSASYIVELNRYFLQKDLMVGVAKAIAFGLIITLSGCLKGLRSSGNSAGVGKATTEAVVLASILILFTNYILTVVFF